MLYLEKTIQALKARINYIFSFFKSDWELEDYPLRIKRQKVNDFESGGRFIAIPWVAQIINWWAMSGHGNTKEEALFNLRNKFNKFKSENNLPRPGTKVPIQFASSTEIDQYDYIAVDFFEKVLDLNYYECIVTDESSLWDFHMAETNDNLNKKIFDAYEVDVSDIKSGNLVEIFRRIELLSNKY